MSATPRSILQQWSWMDTLYRLSDAAAIVLGLLLAITVTSAPTDTATLAGAAAVVAFYFAGEMSGVYRNWRGTSADREILCGVLTCGGAVGILSGLGVLTGYSPGLARPALVIWFLATVILIPSTRVLVRIVQRTLRAQGLNTRGFAIVGVNELGFQLARNIEASPHMGLELVGFYDDRPTGRTSKVPRDIGARMGNLRELVDQARAGKVSMIYITFPMRAEHRIKDVLARLSDTTASVYVVPDFFVFELLHSRWTTIGGLPAVSVFENPFYGVDGLVKRLADICLATFFLLVAALPMAIIALVVKLSSPGPALFRQKRYGLDGQTIQVWKFRSMRTCEDGEIIKQAKKGDPRVTPIGAFLRRSSLDELPQLFNVLEGTMSLVGPRPHANAHNETFRKMIQGYMLRHKVKPGITGLAQVNGARGETDTLDKMQRRIELDHRYIREWSLWLDIKILAKTVLTVFSHPNAY